MLTRKDLVERRVQVPEGVAVTSLVVRTTSGTSGGSPLVTVRASLEFDTAPLREPIQNILVAVGPMNHRLNQLVGCLYRKGADAERMLTFDISDLRRMDSLLADFQAEMIAGTLALATSLVESLTHKRALSGVKLYIVAGSLLSAETAEFLREAMPHALVRGAYTASEVGIMGVSICGYLPRNSFHPHPAVTIELENQGEEGIGDLEIGRASCRERV